MTVRISLTQYYLKILNLTKSQALIILGIWLIIDIFIILYGYYHFRELNDIITYQESLINRAQEELLYHVGDYSFMD